MTEDTEVSSPRHCGLVGGILYMRLRGPMTRFTVNGLMITRLLFFRLVTVAISANSRAREHNIFCSFSFYRGLSMESPVCQRGREDEISYGDDTGNDNHRNKSAQCHSRQGGSAPRRWQTHGRRVSIAARMAGAFVVTSLFP